MREDIRTATGAKALAAPLALPTLGEAMDAVRLSVDRFCLLAGIEALQEMMADDATAVCGARHRRHGSRRGWRWGTAKSEIDYHGGKAKVVRPRVRDRAGKEVGACELGGAPRRRAAARVGHEPDGAQRLDPQVPPRRPSA